MSSFDHILNWELKAGSHKFPGPNGGTCINEAAVVAAGFEYRKVGSHRDCPPCFCPVLSHFAIAVNDHLPDKERNELLMPLVTRLPGSKGEEWVESARANFLMQTLNDGIVTQAVRAVANMFGGRPGRDHDILIEAQRHLANAAKPTSYRDEGAVLQVANYALGLNRLSNVLRSVGMVRWMPQITAPLSLSYAAEETISYEPEFATTTRLWIVAAEQLTRAFEIGPRTPDVDTARVVERMESAKRTAKRQKVAA